MEYYIKKQVTQVRIFQGHHDAVEKMFNRFMIENHFIEIIKINTDTDNGYISKITLYYKRTISIKSQGDN